MGQTPWRRFHLPRWTIDLYPCHATTTGPTPTDIAHKVVIGMGCPGSPRGCVVRVEHGTLLAPEALLAAVQGHWVDPAEPMAGWARELAELYVRWTEVPDEAPRLHQQAGDRITAIDSWVHRQLPRPLPGVHRGTDSVGGVIARVAEAWACAHWTLHHGNDEANRHQTWQHLAEMQQGYAGLIDLALNRRILLPTSWRSLGWPGPHIHPHSNTSIPSLEKA